MKNKCSYVVCISVLILFSIADVKSYPDTPGKDFIVDAPWRTMRDYVPVLFFLPEGSYLLEQEPRIALYAYNPRNDNSRLIFEDTGNSASRFLCSGLSFISSEGKVRSGVKRGEKLNKFWHYIARVPVACLGFGDQIGKRGEHFLKAKFSGHNKILRVIVSTTALPQFNALDQYYDVHVHTIAEQTKWHGLTNGNAARMKYGGPIAMLLESAYTLGMTNTQLNNGNWSSFKNQIVTTDHNSFFSGPPHDAGNHPTHGPTAQNNEFQWYRDNFGELGAEEVTIQGTKGHPKGSPVYNESGEHRHGSHLLSYGAEHFEGPWHGGRFNTPYTKMGTENDITITKAIKKIGSTNGFGYASHPESGGIGWTTDYYYRAIGYEYFNRDKNVLLDFRDGGTNSPILDNTKRDFAFKGLQVWNERNDKVSSKNKDGKKFTTSIVKNLVPFDPNNEQQKFEYKPNWNKEHIETEAKYRELLSRGLNYEFKQQKQHKFIRKLYMSAGTDSHGDFNYSVEGDPRNKVLAKDANWSPSDWKDTFLDLTSFLEDASDLDLDSDNFTDYEHIKISNNGFGRLRTYALTSERYIKRSSKKNCSKNFPFCKKPTPDVGRQSVLAYKEGNTIVTDGPIATFSLDSNCRFDSENMAYHDGKCTWENYDGLIGGSGAFDAGNTMLALKSNVNVAIRYHWLGQNFYLPDPSSTKHRSNDMQFSLEHIFGARKSQTSLVKFTPKGRYFDHDEVLLPLINRHGGSKVPDQDIRNDDIYKNSAFILSGKLRKNSEDETRFITNPVWSSHTTIDVDAPSGCPIKPGELIVTAKFSLSMNTTKPEALNPNNKSLGSNKLSNSLKLYTVQQPKKEEKPKKKNGFDKYAVASVPVNVGEAKNIETVYTGMKVSIKPLDGQGKSGKSELIISNEKSTWESNVYFDKSDDIGNRETIADAKYSTTNSMVIPCGGGWDANRHNKGNDKTSYAVVLSNIKDMHNNPLNAIASSFTVYKKSSTRDSLRKQRKKLENRAAKSN